MKVHLTGRSQAFAVVLGLTDGVLTALTLAATHLFTQEPVSPGFPIRVASGSAVCGAFVFFTAEYARLRGELIHSETELNLSTRGKFATTALGKQIRSEAMLSAVLSSGANFLGAFLPLLIGEAVHGHPLLVLFPSLGMLALLGIALAYTISGRYIFWAGGLAIAGLALSLLGIWLHIA